MKIKDLISNRDKLRKYDELKEWKERFKYIVDLPLCTLPPNRIVGLELPDHIKQIIVAALESEIKKLDEE